MCIRDRLYNNNNTSPLCQVTGEKGDAWTDINVRPFRSDNVLLEFVDTVGVCFSKRISDYSVISADGGFNGTTVILCPRRIMIPSGFLSCDEDNIALDGTNYPAYQVEWSRFGNINLYKYNHADDEWILQ